MKEFAVYTLMRLALFAATFAITYGIWAALSDEPNALVILVVAFLVSGLASYTLLNAQREALAQKVTERADRASAKLEEMRAREDND